MKNPFVGPGPLTKDNPIFGRDREIGELRHLLTAERLVLLHSPSGAGKSSLINAGLVKELQGRFDVWVGADAGEYGAACWGGAREPVCVERGDRV